MQLSLRTKTILGTALIEGVLLLVLVLTANRFMTSIVNENLQKRAFTAVNLFASTTKGAVLSYDIASLESFVQEVLSNPDIEYARVIDANGRVFAEAGAQELLASEFFEDLDPVDVKDGVFDTFANISEGGRVYGRVEIGLGVTSLQQSINNITRWTASIAIIEMLFVAIFSFLLGTVLTRQLQTLKNATSHMSSALSKGKFKGAKVEEKGNDELTDVARAFNILVDSLEEEQAKVSSYQAELETFNKTLEEKIALRTKELAEAQEVLLQKEKMASIGQLAAGVAHEINNPLAYVRSNLVTLRKYSASYALISKQLLNSESNDTNQILEALKTEAIQQDVEHINQDIFELLDETDSGLLRVSDIVKSLKGFSRVESTSLSSIDVNKCVEDSVKMLSGQVEQKATVILSLDKLPSVEANTGQINQILTNLIMNAGQAFDEINLGNGRETIKIQTKAYDNRIEVKVEDNGIGISKQNLSRIFDPFFTTKPVGSGTGLGLSISYKLAKAHGGDLSVFSTPGLGTVFTLSLPIKAKMRE
jgi:signal transduction histidine kinase